MKKILSLTLALAMILTLFAGCGKTSADGQTSATGQAPETAATTEAAASVEGTMEELLNKIVEIQPVEFFGETMTIDLTDTSEEGLWNFQSHTGLENADEVTDVAFFEPMMGSIAYSMVAVRVNNEVGTKSVAEAMKAGINPRKWVCVEANDILVAGYADVVLFIMLDTEGGLTAQGFVDAFQQVVGADLEFVI